MMNWYISLISGLVQGLTEFLPISSSGHLVILHHFFKIPEPQLEFDIFLHLGTMGSVIFVLYKDIVHILRTDRKTLFSLIVATIPIVLIAVFFHERVEVAFGQLRLVGFGLLITALFLLLGNAAENIQGKRKGKLNFMDSILIGTSQALALFPGFSRSGLTISTALATELSKESAVKFSFLLSILAVSGAFLFKMKEFNFTNPGISLVSIILGTLAAFIVGILAIKIVFKVIMARKWYFFAVYCALLGILVLLIS